MKTFIEFLSNKYSNIIAGTENDVLDDDFPDAFDAWLEGVCQDALIKYADEYAYRMYAAGQVAAFNKALECIKNVKV